MVGPRADLAKQSQFAESRLEAGGGRLESITDFVRNKANSASRLSCARKGMKRNALRRHYERGRAVQMLRSCSPAGGL
jgi:hypothetical protein